jgi:hypothetical protein
LRCLQKFYKLDEKKRLRTKVSDQLSRPIIETISRPIIETI